MRRKPVHERIMLMSIVGLLALSVALPASAGQGDWLVRFRGINVDPNDDSGAVHSNGTAVGGSGVTVDDDTVPELDFTYFVRDQWALELILGTSNHDVGGDGSLAALGKIMDTGVLPPTLTLQYHFAPGGKVRPYLGAGLNFTLFYSPEATDAFKAAVGGVRNIDLDSSVGFAAQAGLDIGLSGDWFLNLDYKYIGINTDATIKTDGPLGTLTVDVDINPSVIGVGFGKKF